MSINRGHILFSDLVASLGPGVRIKGADPEVTGVSTDSRVIRPGDVFIAVRGTRVNGMEFVRDAVDKGASALVVPLSRVEKISCMFPGIPVAGVSDCGFAAGVMAARFYQDPCLDFSLVGITGTNGKTTLAYLLHAVFSRAGLNPGMLTTICTGVCDDTSPSRMTTPDPVTLQASFSDMRARGAGAVVMEVSSHALAQDRVAGCRFRLGIFTNLTRDHLDYHHTMDEYFQAKRRFFTFYRPETAVINIDDAYGRRLWEACSGRRVSYGLDPDAMVRPVSYSLDLDGIRAELATPSGIVRIKSSLIGRHNLYNILGAVAGALDLGLEANDIEAGIASLKLVPGRLEPVRSSEGINAFVDYAHTPDGLQSLLGALKDLGASRMITVLGCGGDRDRGKRPEMARIAAEYSDVAVFTSDNSRSEDFQQILEDMLQGIRHLPPHHPATSCNVEAIPDRMVAIRYAASVSRRGDCLVVAGKGHETYQILGGRRIPFDDRKALACALIEREAIRFAEIIEAIGAELVSGDPSLVFKGVFTDSRSKQPGSMFVALKGEHFDGHEFVHEALANGAGALLVSRLPSGIPEGSNPLILMVPDTLRALGDLAAWYRRRIGARVVGITGSCGKTSTKELVASVLGSRWRVAKTMGNFNNLIGLPLSILQAPLGTEWLVLEMGMNRPGEIRRLCEIASPDVGLITNIRPAHLEGLGDLAGIAREKGELFRSLPRDGIAVVNMDDSNCVLAASSADRNPLTRVTYSLEDAAGADVRCTGTKTRKDRTFINVLHDGQSVEVESRLPGRAGAQNVLAAYALGYAVGLSGKEILRGLKGVELPEHRFALLSLPGGWRVIDDAYNANPASMDAALEALVQLTGTGKKAAILGDMLELGRDAGEFHRMLGISVARADLDLVVFVGRFAGESRDGAVDAGMERDRIVCFENTKDLCGLLETTGVSFFPSPSTVLVKGSRAMGLERCVKIISDILSGRCDVRQEPVGALSGVGSRVAGGGV